jgi:hypothetical protein
MLAETLAILEENSIREFLGAYRNSSRASCALKKKRLKI